MKKILTLISSIILVMGLCSCGGSGGLFAKPTPTPIPEISPEDILPAAEVKEFVDYEPVKNGDVTNENNTKTVVYVSDPIGKYDSVTVKLTQFGDNFSKDDVWNLYDGGRIKRSSAKMVDGIGTDAYIAFPSIHIYDKGCAITISAGSGSDSGQESLLKRLGERAVLNLGKYIASDSEEQKQ